LAMILKITLFERNAKKTFLELLVLESTDMSRLILRLNIAIIKLILVVKSKEKKLLLIPIMAQVPTRSSEISAMILRIMLFVRNAKKIFL